MVRQMHLCPEKGQKVNLENTGNLAVNQRSTGRISGSLTSAYRKNCGVNIIFVKGSMDLPRISHAWAVWPPSTICYENFSKAFQIFSHDIFKLKLGHYYLCRWMSRWCKDGQLVRHRKLWLMGWILLWLCWLLMWSMQSPAWRAVASVELQRSVLGPFLILLSGTWRK